MAVDRNSSLSRVRPTVSRWKRKDLPFFVRVLRRSRQAAAPAAGCPARARSSASTCPSPFGAQIGRDRARRQHLDAVAIGLEDLASRRAVRQSEPNHQRRDIGRIEHVEDARWRRFQARLDPRARRGRDRIRADAVFRPFDRGHARQGDDAELGGGVVGLPKVPTSPAREVVWTSEPLTSWPALLRSRHHAIA